MSSKQQQIDAMAKRFASETADHEVTVVSLPAALVDRMAREIEYFLLQEGATSRLTEFAEHVLGALLAECDVRVEEGLRLTWVDGTPDACGDSFDGSSPGWARRAVAYHLKEIAAAPGWKVRPALVRHLIITTPAEVTPEGAKA